MPSLTSCIKKQATDEKREEKKSAASIWANIRWMVLIIIVIVSFPQPPVPVYRNAIPQQMESID